MGKSIIILLISISIISCEFPGEPERIINKKVVTPEAENILFWNDLTNGQHVAGSLDFRIDSTNQISSRTYFYSVGKKYFSAINKTNYTFTIHTNHYPDGKYTIYCGYIDGSEDLGLLNLINFPAKYDSVELYFDQTAPSLTSLSVTNYPGVKMNLKWTKNNDANFYAYILRREDDLTNGNYIYIDTIKDRNQTSFDDYTIPMSSEINAHYEVLTSNRVEETVSNRASIKTNNRVIDFYSNLDIAFVNRELNEIYSYSTTGISTFSTISNSLTKQKIIYNSGALCFDDIVDKLFVARDSGIVVLNPLDFSISDIFYRNIYMAQTHMLFTDARNRLYYDDDYGYGKLIVIDANTGNYLTQYTMSSQLIWTLSNDRKNMYAYDWGKLLKYDLEPDSLTLQKSANLPFYVDELKMNEDDHSLYLKAGYHDIYTIYNRIVKLNANDFSVEEEIYIPSQNTGMLNAYCVRGQYLYFSANDNYSWSTNPRVYEYDLVNKKLVRSWATTSLVGSMEVSPDLKTLYLTEDGSFNRTSYIKLREN